MPMSWERRVLSCADGGQRRLGSPDTRPTECLARLNQYPFPASLPEGMAGNPLRLDLDDRRLLAELLGDGLAFDNQLAGLVSAAANQNIGAGIGLLLVSR